MLSPCDMKIEEVFPRRATKKAIKICFFFAEKCFDVALIGVKKTNNFIY